MYLHCHLSKLRRAHRIDTKSRRGNFNRGEACIDFIWSCDERCCFIPNIWCAHNKPSVPYWLNMLTRLRTRYLNSYLPLLLLINFRINKEIAIAANKTNSTVKEKNG